MPIAIEIFNITNDEIIHFGLLTEEEINAITEQAAKLNLANLQFIDYIGETIFNPEQMVALKSEIEILKKYPEINENLKLIERAINSTPKNLTYYLRFSGE